MGNFSKSTPIGVVYCSLELSRGHVCKQVVVIRELLIWSKNNVSKSSLVCKFYSLGYKLVHKSSLIKLFYNVRNFRVKHFFTCQLHLLKEAHVVLSSEVPNKWKPMWIELLNNKSTYIEQLPNSSARYVTTYRSIHIFKFDS